MRISDWSSDVCSSDLRKHARRRGGGRTEIFVANGGVHPAERGALRQFIDSEQPSELIARIVMVPLQAHRGFSSFGNVGIARRQAPIADQHRSEEHTSELQSLMRISYAVFCLKKNIKTPSHQ